VTRRRNGHGILTKQLDLVCFYRIVCLDDGVRWRLGEEIKEMGKMMGGMSGMIGDMGSMMGEGKMTPEEMGQMSKMMGDMSGMMKQMSEPMNRGVKKAN
jgi:hypothetical protein